MIMNTATTSIHRYDDVISFASVADSPKKFRLRAVAWRWGWSLWIDTDDGTVDLRRRLQFTTEGDGLYANAAEALQFLRQAQAEAGFFHWRAAYVWALLDV